MVLAKQHEYCCISMTKEPPMLLISGEQRLYSIWEKKFYPLSHALKIPAYRKCFGLSYGWFAYVESMSSITLLNPFSGATIHLPKISIDFPAENHLDKIILSCDPCMYPDSWVVVALARGLLYDPEQLAFIRPGQVSWTFPLDDLHYFLDISFYQEELYALISSYEELVVIDFSDKVFSVTKMNTSINLKYYQDASGGNCWRSSYLVESERDLLLVHRFFSKLNLQGSRRNLTVCFKVQKLGESGEWIDVEDLGKCSLFLGDHNESVAIYASNVANFKLNCIYYTCDSLCLCQPEEINSRFPYELTDEPGVYKRANTYIEPFSLVHFPDAIWISPKLGQTENPA